LKPARNITGIKARISISKLLILLQKRYLPATRNSEIKIFLVLLLKELQVGLSDKGMDFISI
jgi:hypothetical protein